MTDHALLLVNLGSPASTEVGDVRRYLNQFLMDPYVIDVPWPLRRLIVGMILLRRPAASAEAYRSIWWEDGSPLIVISRRLQQQVASRWTAGPVELAMRYGEPSIASGLRRLAAQGVQRVTLVPLYPQFAASTVTTAIEEAQRAMTRERHAFALDVLPPFYDQPEYLQALAASAQPYLAQGFDHLLLSYHGLPERHLHRSDPTGSHCLKGADCCQRATGAVLASCYRAQCIHTSQGFAAAAGLADTQWSVSFQSRLGRAKWIEPYTEATLDELAARGVKKLLVMCPAFVADCIETLEEIGERGREQFIHAGGEDLQLVPCLNDHPAWADALVELCRRMPVAL